MTVILIGSGRVATSLGRALEQTGVQIVAFYNRQGVVPAGFDSTGTLCTADANELPATADFVLAAVSDEGVTEVLQQVPNGPIPVHFSGALPDPSQGAVIWPMQSVQMNDPGSVDSIPMMVSAKDTGVLERASALARHISQAVYPTDETTRQTMHLAAVFAANFTNHSVAIAHELCLESGMEWSHFAPLLTATFNGAIAGQSKTRQTGPALRNETAVMRAHLDALAKRPEWKAMYEAISASIQGMHRIKD